MSEIACMFCSNLGGWLNRVNIHRVGVDAIFECDWCALDLDIRIAKEMQI